MPCFGQVEHLIATFMCVWAIQNAVKIALATHKNQYKPIHSQYAKTEAQLKSKFRFILDNLIANGRLFCCIFVAFVVIAVVVCFSYKSAANAWKIHKNLFVRAGKQFFSCCRCQSVWAWSAHEYPHLLLLSAANPPPHTKWPSTTAAACN